MGHQSYVLLYTKTILSNHPVVFPKSSCDVHLLRSPWVRGPGGGTLYPDHYYVPSRIFRPCDGPVYQSLRNQCVCVSSDSTGCVPVEPANTREQPDMLPRLHVRDVSRYPGHNTFHITLELISMCRAYEATRRLKKE